LVYASLEAIFLVAGKSDGTIQALPGRPRFA
jgi:hypothetical protein